MYVINLIIGVEMYDLQEETIYDPREMDDSYAISSAKLELEENAAGKMELSIPPTNRCFDKIERLKTFVRLKKISDGSTYWEGRVVEVTEDIWRQKNVVCEGPLTYLNDAIQPYTVFGVEDENTGEIRFTLKRSEVVRALIERHNEIVGWGNMNSLEVGTIDLVSDVDEEIEAYTSYGSTFEELKKIIDSVSGSFVWITYDYGTKYLNWTNNRGKYAVEQNIVFGKNLLDYSSNMTIDDIFTSVVPLGKKLDFEGYNNTELRLNVSDLRNYIGMPLYPNQYVYLDFDDFPDGFKPDVLPIHEFGNVSTYKVWDYIEDPKGLVSKAKFFLQSKQFDAMTLDISAFDLSILNPNIDDLKLSYLVKVVCPYHGLLDKWFPITKITIDITSPENTRYILNGTAKRSSRGLSGTVVSNKQQSESEIEGIKTEDEKSSSTNIVDTGKEYIGTNWTILDKDYRITKTGWYNVEGHVVRSGDEKLPTGVALSVGKGWDCPGMLSGSSWEFRTNDGWVDEYSMSGRDLPEGVSIFKINFAIPYGNYGGELTIPYLPMDTIEVEVSNRKVDLIRYKICSYTQINTYPSGLSRDIIAYTHSNGWANDQYRRLAYVYGGEDNENLKLIKFLCTSAVARFGSVMDKKIKEDSPVEETFKCFGCKFFYFNENMTDPFTETTTTKTYKVYFNIRTDILQSHYIRPEYKEVIVTEEAGVGVTKIKYVRSKFALEGFDGEEITVYTKENKWVKTEYRYMIAYQHEESEGFDLWAITKGSPVHDLYGSSWVLNNPPYRPEGFMDEAIIYPYVEFPNLPSYNSVYVLSSSISLYVIRFCDLHTGVMTRIIDDTMDPKWNVDYQEVKDLICGSSIGRSTEDYNSEDVIGVISTYVDRKPIPPDFFAITSSRVRLASKKENSEKHIAGDIVYILSTSAPLYLGRNEAIRMYGKAKTQGDYQTYLKIRGPM